MKRAIAVVLIGSAIAATPTLAADFGWNGTGGAAAPIYSSTSAFNWGGFYAGVNAGYGFGTVTQDPNAGPTTENNTDGWDLGGQVGYNYDMGGFILGGEADLQWSSIAYSEELGGGSTLDAGIDNFGTLRARAGMAFDRVMPFVTAGVAYGNGKLSVTDNAGVTTSQSNTHIGWTAGVGLEAAIADNVTLKAEYLYVDLGEQNYISGPGGGIDTTQRFSVVRAGLNYKF